jgi:hypothetical protein
MDCLILQSSAGFLSILFQIDCEEARQDWGKRCPHFKDGTLAWGNWTRALRILDVTAAADDAGALRFSLCCTLCRRHVTPKSARFAGRSPNPSGIVAFARVIGLLDLSVCKGFSKTGAEDEPGSRKFQAGLPKSRASTYCLK